MSFWCAFHQVYEFYRRKKFKCLCSSGETVGNKREKCRNATIVTSLLQVIKKKYE